MPQVLAGSQALGYPLDTVVPIGLLLLIGGVLYAFPRFAAKLDPRSMPHVA